MYQLIFQLQPKNFFFGIKNIFRKKIGQKYFSVKIPKKIWNSKNVVRKSKFQIFSGFSPKKKLLIFFRKIFLNPKKHIFWLELEKKLVHNFDVENWELSIYEVFRAIPALCREVGANIWHHNFKNRINFAPVPLADFMNFEDFISKKCIVKSTEGWFCFLTSWTCSLPILVRFEASAMYALVIPLYVPAYFRCASNRLFLTTKYVLIKV